MIKDSGARVKCYMDDYVVEFYNASIDLAFQRAFAMYGIDVDKAKQLVGSGRLKILTGGMLPAFNAIAILDGVDLFSLKVLGELEYERCVYTTRIEFMAMDGRERVKEKQSDD